jgi:glycosyltransferase involved in cell wall biosynthesis
VKVGLLPSLGGGLRALAATGQAARLVDAYMKPYSRAFDAVAYFSYYTERLDEYTDDRALLARVRVVPPPRPMSRGRRAATMAWSDAAELRACDVLRVFQVTGAIPAVAANARFGVPYATTYGFSYGQLSRPGPTRLLKAVVERVSLRRAAAVIVTTEALRARASRWARRVELIPNGVDTTRFAPPATVAARPGPRRILYVGRFSAEKNLSALVRAAADLGRRVPVRLVLVGAGPLEARLRQELSAAGVDAEFPGVIGQERLPSVYAAADAFVLASFTEGHPKVLIEAMACGVPCVASSCDGNRSLVTEGETGLLFDPRRPDELARALERVLSEPALAACLARRGRELVLERYDLSLLVQREIALLRAIRRNTDGG